MTDFTQQVEVETPELVVLSYTIAGMGSRVYAAFMDMLICIGMLLGIGLASVALEARFGVRMGFGAASSWTAALLGLFAFAVFWGYFVICECLFDGQTFGKWRLGLRVVRDGGYSVGFPAAAARNIMRAIDMQPGVFYLFGITSIALSKRGKRLGDMVAGTIVIQEKLVDAPMRKEARRAAPAVLPTVQLSEEEFRLVERWYNRRMDIEPERRKALTTQIADRVRRALPGDGTPDSAKLIRLFEAERQARDAGAASRNETGAARERYAIVSTNSPRWVSFASTVAEAQRRGLRSLGEKRVREFVSDYRSLSSDLARLRTASRDTEATELFYLSRLVGAAHNLLYRTRGGTLNGAFRFMFVESPREVRRSAKPILLAALLLFLPAFIAGTAVIQHPNVAAIFIPPGMLDRAEAGIQRAKNGSGYIEDPQVFRPVMASSIIRNNVQVTFVAFAFGITAGIGTALALVMNGISFGGVIGLYQTKGILPLLIAFVAPHGVLELSAICIAAGGGFLIAAAILIPGQRTRRRALAENGRRAVNLVSVSTLMLIVAGSIEGMVSPIPYWPLRYKLSVSAVTALFLYLYLRGGSKRPRHSTADPALDERADLLGLGGSESQISPRALTSR